MLILEVWVFARQSKGKAHWRSFKNTGHFPSYLRTSSYLRTHKLLTQAKVRVTRANRSSDFPKPPSLSLVAIVGSTENSQIRDLISATTS